MTGIRHFTASAIVFDDRDRVLLVHHNKIGRWLYPGGHIDANEDPAQAAQREVLEETGIRTEVISNALFAHPAVTTHAAPYTIIEMDVADASVGPHRHIDLVYVLRAMSGDLAAQRDEVADARWVPLAELTELDTPAELPALVTAAVSWAKVRTPPALPAGF
ncbi:NUDIX hydrolase [Planosporangium sp. 12N6]|uniref:NUDIX hydrolase n=1 Tax=Planosporangium spinosum TaxID=3402278 RepID=UPI003CEEB040